MAVLHLPLWLFVSARSIAVDPAREDVDGFDAPGNLVMSVGLHLASLDVSFIAQIGKTWKTCLVE